ncbi:hypothetical protein QNI19_13155 [Cytophagaceae bacterium DM2B3-1]|uniref:Uncharacterized protein n=1 Tax=Xanthocytophaga flava TaxID=3048013 RepID=A0ABT7CMI4_9BACT|nr:hypothetical protein [Xanthocytophaga flavus]MDJ1493884.1 hypothetical protein [Xanthocytophaga flavus]
MKKMLVAIIALIMCVPVFSQQPEETHHRGQREEGRPPHQRGGRPHSRERDGLRVLSEYKGTLVDFTYNEEKAYNGFTLSAEGKNTEVRFAPHLAKEIMGATKKGGNVTVMGFKRSGKDGAEVIVLNSITSGSKTVYEHRPDRDGRPKEEFTKADGKVTALAKDKEGRVNGVYLDKSLVRFAPHVAFQLGDKLSVGKAITITGYVRGNREGEVFVENTKVIMAQTLAVDGTTYAVR